jgi:hypothetical protein
MRGPNTRLFSCANTGSAEGVCSVTTNASGDHLALVALDERLEPLVELAEGERAADHHLAFKGRDLQRFADAGRGRTYRHRGDGDGRLDHRDLGRHDHGAETGFRRYASEARRLVGERLERQRFLAYHYGLLPTLRVEG